MESENNSLSWRFKTILNFIGISQRQFSKEIGVTETYISKLLNRSDRNISKNLAFSIENKFGINADWILNGQGEMVKTYSKCPQLTSTQKLLMLEVESLSLKQREAVLAFVRMLKKIESENKSAHEAEKMEEYSKFLEWQNEQKNKNKK